MSDKKVSFESALKNNFIKKFDYTKFKNIKRIAGGGFGTVYRANSLNSRKHVALKCLHENDESFYEKFVKETYYLVLQYAKAKDGDLRTYLRNNFNTLDWKIKIQMAKDITSGLYCIHGENIVHRDLHSKNILVHEGSLLITDLGLSQPLDTNSNSFKGGMLAYSDPGYSRNPLIFKRSKASDIYSLGVLLWEISSGKPPSLETTKVVINGEREVPINGTPEDYIIIYSNAWKDDPNQRPTIKNIFDSLENIKLENLYNGPNDNQEAYTNNQSHASMDAFSKDYVSQASMDEFSKDSVSQASMDEFSKDSVSFSSSFTASNWGKVTEISQVSTENIKDPVSDQTLTDLANLEITGIDNSSIHENNLSISNIS
ncbi:hypothetical protein Glove_266g1 [Diversispora epigaea]|uniref:Protein kinase domain-containing protein n=1 Tax=Diversispora epigaea TaxID=1348612 RepID=A0A397IAL9_9GLOM|nr:hypothetical protein Glove_266g1 [Diversispora epigaea]